VIARTLLARRAGALVASAALAGALVTVAASAAAEEVPKTEAAGQADKRDAAKPAPLPADVTLTIDASTPRGTWKMRVTNQGDVPVTLVADARLLSLDITPRSARKPEHCQLPADMRPQDDLGRPLVLPPKRSYAERFEPRLFCLDGARLDALASGSIVVATLGWSGKSTKPPLVVSPVEGLQGRMAPAKAIVSAPIALPDEPSPEPSLSKQVARDEATASMSNAPWLVVRSGRSVDATSAQDVTIPVTLTNAGHRTVVVRFRPETLAFDVVGPTESVHCAWPAMPSAPTRDLFTTLAGGGSTTLTVVLSAYCPSRVLQQAGLYVVRAALDTRKASGAEIGIRTFDGQVTATSPTLVRLRRGASVEPVGRPMLQPE
jgi:hypothetical protein